MTQKNPKILSAQKVKKSEKFFLNYKKLFLDIRSMETVIMTTLNTKE